MITNALIERIFSAANIERWNDHPHPGAFTELGKQAHKMMIAWLIAMDDENDDAESRNAVDWNALIELGMFEFLHRVVVTDIRPPVFHRLMRNKDDGRKLNGWVAEQLHDEIKDIPNDFEQKFKAYFDDDDKKIFPTERKILRAAHYLATHWEFGFIQTWSGDMYGIEKTRGEIRTQVWEQSDISVVQKILDAPRAREGAFVSLAGQLTFQKRWAQTPRVPATSVLGHLFFVAAMSWLVSLEIAEKNPSLMTERRCRNNFFGGLFHDIPEVLTRDIISPVKKSVEGLDTLVSNYEQELMRERILNLIPKAASDELHYFTNFEFADRTKPDGSDPIDGRLIEICDKFGAYIECAESIRNGTFPKALVEGKNSLFEKFHDAEIFGYEVGKLFQL